MTQRQNSEQDDELTPDEEAFARRAGEKLRDSSDALDAATLSRLNRARQRSLDEMPGQRDLGQRDKAIGWLVPAGVAAAAAVVVVGVWQSGGTPGDGTPAIPVTGAATAAQFEDLELLLDDGLRGEGDLEMIEDLEFFAWLATEDLDAAG
ncbi:MAG: hypothetical protein ACR2QV_13975 [Gammaproteobacteria bacterium]